MQFFNHSNSEVEYIKDILRTTYIPTVRMFNTDSTAQPAPTVSAIWGGSSSIKELTVSELSSHANEEDRAKVFADESIVLNNTIQVGVTNKTTGEVTPKYVGKYTFGTWYKNLTTNYISNKSYYDYNLHENFGRYLRAYRDYYQVDVMNFYNCFSNRYINSFSLPFTSYTEDLPTYDDNYRIVAFPILYDTTYHMMFSQNTVGKVTIQAIYFTGDVPIARAEGSVTNPITYSTNVNQDFYFCIGSKTPVSEIDSSTITDEGEIQSLERLRLSKQRLLYILVQFPQEVSGPIVVMEQPKFTYAINNELLNLSPYETEQVAFSDTLLEYITGNAITMATRPGTSVKKIQEIISSDEFLKKFGVGGVNLIGSDIENYTLASGVFDIGMQKIIYKALFNYGVPKEESISGNKIITYPLGQERLPNFMGFVDKNVEKALLSFWADFGK